VRRRAVTAWAHVALAATAVAIAAPSPAAASPSEELQVARDAFRRRDWTSALPVLSSLLYPRPRLAGLEDLFEAHLLLGMCAFESGDRATASREFDEAIYLVTDRQLDTVLFSGDAVALYDERREAITERLRLEDEKRKLAIEREKYRAMLAAMVVVEKRDYYVNYIPFGAGQFQNKQTKKGIAFATAQGVTGAVSAGIWMYLVGSYGLSGTVPDDEAAQVRRLQQIEIGAGALFLGLVAAGVVDALINYKPSVVRKPDESVLPPELRLDDEPRAPGTEPGLERPPARGEPERTPATTFRLAPTPLPGGAGVVMSWTF
jgi:hypothetical protein